MRGILRSLFTSEILVPLYSKAYPTTLQNKTNKNYGKKNGVEQEEEISILKKHVIRPFYIG